MAELTTEENQVVEASDSGNFGEPMNREETTTQDAGSEDAGKTATEETTEVTEEGAEGTGKTEETVTTEETTEGTPKLTEKGTKLDPNPESAVHQELANARRAQKDMAETLANPEKLARFMEVQYGIKAQLPPKEGEAPKVELKQYKAEDFENLEDVAKVVNELQTSLVTKVTEYEAEIKSLRGTVQDLQTGGRNQQIATKMSEDVASLQSQPELDSKSPDFIEGLEEDIASMYHQLDFNEETRSYRGNYSMAEIGNRIIAAARKARQQGTQKAQTIVKDKSVGKVVTSPKVKEDTGPDTLTPGDSIADGISKMFQ